MRYDTAVVFIRDGEKTYNRATGDYDKIEPSETKIMASVMDTSEEMLKIVYGELPEASYTIQIQNHYDQIFDRIRIGSKEYKVDRTRRLRTKQTFIVSEVK